MRAVDVFLDASGAPVGLSAHADGMPVAGVLQVDGEVIDAIAVADVGGMCYQIDDTGINAG